MNKLRSLEFHAFAAYLCIKKVCDLLTVSAACLYSVAKPSMTSIARRGPEIFHSLWQKDAKGRKNHEKPLKKPLKPALSAPAGWILGATAASRSLQGNGEARRDVAASTVLLMFNTQVVLPTYK